MLRKAGVLWHRSEVLRIEDLRDAVWGADIEPIQMAGPSMRCSLACSVQDDVVLSSGLIGGRVTLYGALSKNAITLIITLRAGAGARHWLNPLAAGDIDIVMPRDVHDAYYSERTLYLAACLPIARLNAEVRKAGRLAAGDTNWSTGLRGGSLTPEDLNQLNTAFERIHAAPPGLVRTDAGAASAILRAALVRRGEWQSTGAARNRPLGVARVVHRARDFIRENLDVSLSLETVAEAAGTSPRTLARAFRAVLDDSPMGYVSRMRLHRIRMEIASEAEARSTISMISARWGVPDSGRMATRYRALFGESPSTTLSSHQSPTI